ncbi:MAG: NADPH:quinone oxidoreductase family protein [bacterium]|nr:NADPH:quinone oxidoreductase family protein [bacterium]
MMEPHELRVLEAPEPGLQPGSLGIEVRAAGCNFFDTLICRGRYQVKPPLPFVPGGEISGVVRELGEGAEGFEVGDRVSCSLGSTGGYAERAVVPTTRAWKMPDAMSFAEGAALPIVYPTSYAGLVYRARLEAGETLLVHAAAGGVGIAAVQIGRALGARVIATAGGEDKLAVAREAGAELAIDYRQGDFAARVMEETGGHGADVIYDPVGGEIFDQSLKCIAWNGRLLVIGFASGTIPTPRLNRVLLKNIALVGLHWPPYFEKEPERVDETFGALFALYYRGAIRPPVHRSYPLEQAAEALAELASRGTTGKVVLEP